APQPTAGSSTTTSTHAADSTLICRGQDGFTPRDAHRFERDDMGQDQVPCGLQGRAAALTSDQAVHPFRGIGARSIRRQSWWVSVLSVSGWSSLRPRRRSRLADQRLANQISTNAPRRATSDAFTSQRDNGLWKSWFARSAAIKSVTARKNTAMSQTPWR